MRKAPLARGFSFNQSVINLNNGLEMPAIGLGVFDFPGTDDAQIYGNAARNVVRRAFVDRGILN